MKSLQLRQRVGRTRLTFELRGDLDQAGQAVMDEILSRARTGPPTLHLDLAGVAALDLRGLSWLLSLERQLRNRGQKLQIHRPTRQVKRILRLVHPAVRPTAAES